MSRLSPHLAEFGYHYSNASTTNQNKKRFLQTLSLITVIIHCSFPFCRRFGTKCGGCSQGISPNDLVRRARSKVFHLNCFTCMMCNKQLSTGEELYIIDENKFVCKDDYLSNTSVKDTNLLSGTCVLCVCVSARRHKL